MRPIIRQHFIGELVISSGGSTLANAISEAVSAGELRKVVSNIYTSSVGSHPADVLRRNLYIVLGRLYPGSILSHRSALEGGPTLIADNEPRHIVLTYKYDKRITLPGLVVHLVKGDGPLPGDLPFAEGLYIASPERAWLENYQRGKKGRGGFSKTISKERAEEILDGMVRTRGEEFLRELTNRIHALAKQIGLDSEAEQFQKVAGALLGTRSASSLVTDRAKSRAAGEPFCPERLSLFEQLFQMLHRADTSPSRLSISQRLINNSSLSTLCFFDAYFSNYIEGTRFEVDEARMIAFEGKIPERRPDGHDVLGTFRTLLAVATDKSPPWQSADEMIDVLKRYHRDIMGAHTEKFPGEFKNEQNFAGSTAFVEPELVKGTLRKGFEFYKALSEGFPRALFIKFLIAEVHPFMDGNGRLSRIVMNREFYRANEVPIVIPTVYRLDYLGGVKKLTRTSDADTYIRMMRRAQVFTASLNLESFESARQSLAKARAFSDDAVDILTF